MATQVHTLFASENHAVSSSTGPSGVSAEMASLLCQYAKAKEEFAAATAAMRALAPLVMPEPTVTLGTGALTRDWLNGPRDASSAGEIFEYYRRRKQTCLTTGLKLELDRECDEKFAELCELSCSYEEHMKKIGYFAAQERLALAVKALEWTEDAIVDFRASVFADVVEQARFILANGSFHEGGSAVQLARSIVACAATGG